MFHRIVPGFVIQGGDPTGTGSGDAGYSIVDEPVVGEYGRGIVAMARTQAPNSQGSQFFIVLDDDAKGALDQYRTYAIFGRVVEGMDVVDAIAAGPSTGHSDDRALEPVAIESTTIEQVVLPPEPSPRAADRRGGARRTWSRSAWRDSSSSRRASRAPASRRSSVPTIRSWPACARSPSPPGGRSSDVALAVAGLDLPSGQPLDVTALRVGGADAAQLVVPFASLVTSDDGVTAMPATLGGRDVMAMTYGPITSTPPDGARPQRAPSPRTWSGDTVVLIRTADEAGPRRGARRPAVAHGLRSPGPSGDDPGAAAHHAAHHAGRRPSRRCRRAGPAPVALDR